MDSVARNSAFVFCAIFCAICLLSTTSTGIAFAATFQSEKSQIASVSDIANLIEQLDSDNFQLRELAASQLIEIGEPAIGPLAFKSFECTPETCWRIKKTLEQICTTGSETVFYKTTGILQLRFDTGSAAMNQRLSQLKAKWKTQRKKEAFARLRKHGAKIVDPWEGIALPEQTAAQQLIQARGMGANFVLINGEFVEVKSNSTQTQIRTKRKVSLSEQKKRISTILKSELKEVRKLVLGANQATPTNQTNQDALELQRLMMRDALFAPGVGSSSGGVTVELAENWKGESAKLKDLSEIPKLTELKLTKQALDKETIAAISEIPTLTKLVIEQCQIDLPAIKKANWPHTLTEIELGKTKLKTELIESLRSLTAAQMMTFRDCDFKGVGFDSLRKLDKLRGLRLKDSQIPKEFFKVAQRMTQLTYLNFET